MDSRFAVKIEHLMDNPMESKGYMPQSNIGWNSSTTHMDRNSDFGQERFQGHERLTIRPREYNGETNWEDYFKYFERVCKLNRWQDEKLDYLWVSLVGPALEYADLKVMYVHDLLKIVGNSVSNVQIAFISSDLLRYSLFGITCFGSFRYLTLACKYI